MHFWLDSQEFQVMHTTFHLVSPHNDHDQHNQLEQAPKTNGSASGTGRIDLAYLSGADMRLCTGSWIREDP
jgi:hypothetical protein